MSPDLVPLPQFWLYQSAFVLQAIAVALFFVYALAPRRAISLCATILLSLAALFQVSFLGVLGASQGGLPLASGFGALCSWSLIFTVLVLWAEWRHQLGLLGAFLAPVSALMLLMGFRFAKADAWSTPGLGGAWLALHVTLAMLGYACFSAAASVAAAFLVQERQLKRKHLGSLVYELPPLAVLEDLAANFAWSGCAALGASLAVGFIWQRSLGLALSLGDPKVRFSLLVWLAYAGSSLLRQQSALRGRRYAYLLLVLFLAIFFGYYLLNIYFGGHGFLKPVAGA
jgi:ABC-type uncharacterized transport system permease subunit